MIDFAGQLKGLEAVALAYLDLSVNGDVEGAATGLFRALRWAEGQPSAQRLLIVGAYNSFGLFSGASPETVSFYVTNFDGPHCRT